MQVARQSTGCGCLVSQADENPEPVGIEPETDAHASVTARRTSYPLVVKAYTDAVVFTHVQWHFVAQPALPQQNLSGNRFEIDE